MDFVEPQPSDDINKEKLRISDTTSRYMREQKTDLVERTPRRSKSIRYRPELKDLTLRKSVQFVVCIT